MKDVIIVGAGISGLSAALELHNDNIDFHVLELSDRVGGTIESIKKDECLIETGPNTFNSSSKELLEIIRDLELEDLLLKANENSKKRFIYCNGKLLPIPKRLNEFFKSEILSKDGKITLFEEFFIKKEDKQEESIEEFFSRRFGREVLKNIIQPFLSGVYAGDVKKLSVNAIFPKLKFLENKYKSILLGFILSGQFKNIFKKFTLYSFKDGLATLTNTIYEKLKTKTTLGIKNIEITRAKDFFIVTFKVNNKTINYTTNSILFALPAHKIIEFSYLLPDESIADFIDIEYMPIAVVNQIIDKSKVNLDLEGFGYLCTKEPHRKLLGTIWTSSVFPDRSPANKVLLTSYIGGAYYKKIQDLSEEEIANITAKEVAEILNISDVSFIKTLHVKTHAQAIPQYNIGHLEKTKRIEGLMDTNYGLFFTGNYMYGISLNDAVKTSKLIVNKIKEFLKHQRIKETKEEPIIAHT